MKIGIIIEPYEEENTSGISYAIMSQASGLLKIDSENEYILYTHKPISSNRFKGNFRNVLIPKSFLGKNAWFIFASLFRRKDTPDVLLFNMPLLPLVLPSSIKTIPIFYELAAYQKQHVRVSVRTLLGLLYRVMEKTAVKRSSHIVTAATGVQRELIEYFKLPKEKIAVIYLGFQKFNEDKGVQSVFSKQHNHFLFVGRVKYKKNVHNIVKGFIQFRKENPQATNKLFVVGLYGGSYYEGIVKNVQEAGLENDVIFTGFVTNNDLYHLYKNACGLAFCSLQEGFGMPILEAMDFGVPVITSNRAPMNEVGGEAALIVDPESISGIAGAMKTLTFDEVKRKEHIRRGKEHASKFSWEKHVKGLFRVIMSTSLKRNQVVSTTSVPVSGPFYEDTGHVFSPPYLDEKVFAMAMEALIIVCTDIILVDTQGRFILAYRKHPAAEGWWWMGGREYVGETPMQAIERILLREIGFSIKKIELLTIAHYLWADRLEQPHTVGRHDLSQVYIAEVSEDMIKDIKLDPEEYDIEKGLIRYDGSHDVRMPIREIYQLYKNRVL